MATLTQGLKNLQRQLDDAFSGRHKPDGWIGDSAHRSRTSGHNPDDTAGSRPAWSADPDSLAEVRALDVAADLGPDVDSGDVVAHLIRLPKLGTVIRYIIHRGKIYHSRTGFKPETYSGDNGHYHHIHFEGAWSQAADTNTAFDFKLEDIPVALTDADKKWLSGEIDKAATRAAERVWKTKLNVKVGKGEAPSLQEAGSILRYGSSEHHAGIAETRAVGKEVAELRAEVKAALKPPAK